MEAVEQLKITSTNLRSILTRSNNRLNQLKARRLKLKKQMIEFRLRNKRSSKLGTKSKFTSTLKNIKGSTPAFVKDPVGSLLTVAAFLLLGFVINNIGVITQKVQQVLKNIKDTFVPITEVIQEIYDSASGFVKMFRDETKNDDFEKVADELEQSKPIIDQIQSDFKSIQDKLKEGGGYNIGQVTDSGEMPDGSGSYDKVMLYDKEQDKVVPYYRITDAAGNITIVKVSDFFDDLFKEAEEKDIIDLDELKQKGKSFYKEKNQWWDVFDVFPNQLILDEEKFQNIEGLPNTNYKDPKKSNTSEIKVLRQPVIIDP